MLIDVDYADRLGDLQLQATVWWTLAAASLVLLLGLAARPRRRPQCGSRASPCAGLRALHRSESATASMEYLLVLFPFLIIVMTVWQLAFMINAQLHIGYAAYAAARSASVMIPADLESEKEGMLEKKGQSGAGKWERIHTAALPGTIAISPGNMETATGVALVSGIRADKGRPGLRLPDAADLGSLLALRSIHHTEQSIFSGTRLQRTIVKYLYADHMTEVLINGKNDTETQNLAGADTVSVTVNYTFWLHVPYVGRLLEAMFQGWKNPLTGEYLLLNPYPSMQLSETITMTSWTRKRAIEPCNDQ